MSDNLDIFYIHDAIDFALYLIANYILLKCRTLQAAIAQLGEQ